MQDVCHSQQGSSDACFPAACTSVLQTCINNAHKDFSNGPDQQKCFGACEPQGQGLPSCEPLAGPQVCSGLAEAQPAPLLFLAQAELAAAWDPGEPVTGAQQL